MKAAWVAWLVPMWCVGCDDARHARQRDELAREAADYVADVARRDPERAGKVGVARALHVRAQALGRARDIAHRHRFTSLAPTCRPHLIPPDTLELVEIKLQVSGKRAFAWQQRIATTRHAGAEHMIVDERYTDDDALLPGERFTQTFWTEGERWTRSARGPSAQFVKDPYPGREWHTHSARQRAGMEAMVALVDVWRGRDDGSFEWDAQGKLELGCERSNDSVGGAQVTEELKDLIAMRRGRLEDATLRRDEFEGIQGWRVSARWRLGERDELTAEIWRGRRGMTAQELQAWALPQRAMEATAGQGERPVLPVIQDEEDTAE